MGKYGINEVERDVTDFITQQNKNGIPDKYIHIIWYCFTPLLCRLEQEEVELLERLSNNYSIDALPIILVGTKSNSKQMVKQYKEHFEKSQLKIKFDFIPVLAKQLDESPSSGLDELEKISIEKSKKAIKSQCYQGILQDVKKLFENTLEEKSKELIVYIEEAKNNILRELDKEMDKGVVNFNSLKTKILDIFILIFNGFNNFLDIKEIKGNNMLSKNTIDCISKFIEHYFELSLKDYIICLNDFVSINSQNIAININDFQNNYNITHENEVYVKTAKSWQNILGERIINEFQSTAEIYCIKNAFKYLSDLLISNFKDAYLSTYKYVIDANTTKTRDINELIESKITSQFDQIYKKIEKHQEKRKKEEEENRKKLEEEKRKKEEEKKENHSSKKYGNGAYNPEEFV